MFGSDYHVSCPKERVGASGIHAQLTLSRLTFCGSDGKVNFGTGRATNPIALHVLDAFGPIELIEAFEQALSIMRNAQQPLLQIFALYLRAAFFVRAIVQHFFVGAHNAALATPPHLRVGVVS